MPRYIDLDKQLVRLYLLNLTCEDVIKEFLLSADVVERKNGKWKQGYCSECGYNWGNDAPVASVPNYCPNCGARMFDKDTNVTGKGDSDAEIR